MERENNIRNNVHLTIPVVRRSLSAEKPSRFQIVITVFAVESKVQLTAALPGSELVTKCVHFSWKKLHHRNGKRRWHGTYLCLLALSAGALNRSLLVVQEIHVVVRILGSIFSEQVKSSLHIYLAS